MAATTKVRPLRRHGASPINPFQAYGVRASTRILGSALVALDAAGLAGEATTALALTVVGIAFDTVDNTGGAAGERFVRVEAGEYELENSTGPDAIGLADIGKPCFAVDNQTVAKTDGTGTRSRAGLVVNMAAGRPVVRLGVGV